LEALGGGQWFFFSGFGVWVLADVSERRGQTQNSILDPSWTIPMEGYAIWTHEWAS